MQPQLKPLVEEHSHLDAEAQPIKKVSIICSKGTLDMAYPGLILANAARMSGIDACCFFTFWGLDIVTDKTMDKLRIATVGNPNMHIPTMVGGLPGMQNLASYKMKKDMEKLDLPSVREMIEMLDDAGCKMYACQMAMEMFNRTEQDLVPQVDSVITAMDFYDVSQGAQIIFI